MAYKKTEAERAKDYFKRYLAVQNPRPIADNQIRFVVNNFNLEFVKLYNRTMEALMTEELRQRTEAEI
jgi:hypothetical protein